MSHPFSFPLILSPAHVQFLVHFQSFPCFQILWTQANCLWFQHTKWNMELLKSFKGLSGIILSNSIVVLKYVIFSRSYNMITSLEPFWIDFKWSSEGLFGNTWTHLQLWTFSSHSDQRIELTSLILLFASGRFPLSVSRTSISPFC